MKNKKNLGVRPREVLAALLALPASVLVMAVGPEAFAAVQELEPTPACGDGEDSTPPQTAGPFFKPRSPERKTLVDAGIQGTKVILDRQIRTTMCKPVRRALLDIWQADASGVYGNTGYKLRGHQFTNDQGRYRLETIIPGLYPGRTRHFQVRAQAAERSAFDHPALLSWRTKKQTRRDLQSKAIDLSP